MHPAPPPYLTQLSHAGSWRLRGGLLPTTALIAYRGQFIEPSEVNAAKMRTIKLLGPNREVINEMIRTRREHGLVSAMLGKHEHLSA